MFLIKHLKTINSGDSMEYINSDLFVEIENDLSIDYDRSNLKEREVLRKIIYRVLHIASDYTNRKINDKKLEPYVVDCTKAIYLKRGDEDKDAMSEGGESYTYKNAIKEMKQNLVSIRKFK